MGQRKVWGWKDKSVVCGSALALLRMQPPARAATWRVEHDVQIVGGGVGGVERGVRARAAASSRPDAEVCDGFDYNVCFQHSRVHG
eukprot:555636-Rhodomonas_salina.1